MKIKTKGTNWPRLVAQWGVILFILILAFLPQLTKITTPDFEAYCPFGGLQALGSYLLSQALSCTMTSAQIVMGILLFAGVLLFSKLFCSFICPIGTVSEWLGKLGDKLKVRFTIKGVFDKILRSLKYILLFITLYFTLQSNELFCKKFDPYFALASGFNTDVVVLYAIIAIVLVVFGSVFIRLFWCKYLCPLGAISNIFKFSIFFVATLGVYLILLKAGVEVSYVWPLAIACAGGYIIELVGQKSRFFPLARITRNTTSCIDCQLCSKKCPQAIDVASLKVVKDVDCNMCGDCLLVCPVENTLTINKRKEFKWLPIIATVVLVTLGVIVGKMWEVPTVDIKWGEPEEIESASVFTQSGLKNIKCYGSSMAFVSKMKNVAGVYGVATYVKHNRVKMYYDSDRLNEEKIQELLFTPQKKTLKSLAKDVKNIYAVTLKLENFFDSYDFSYLGAMLASETNAVGLISEFDCPVLVKIYFPEEIKNKEALFALIESKEYTFETTQGPRTIELEYEIALEPEYSTISRKEYIGSLFTPFERTFNYRNDYTDDVIKTYILPLGNNSKLRNKLSYIVSHLSNDNGVVEFKTELDTSFTEIAEIAYVDSMTNAVNIEQALLSDSLTISYSNGRQGKVPNMFDFSEEVKSATQQNQQD
uniref:4Fe-4S binding protein n=1 Tax=uncultured Draconibacterium sp. TaxID=1573823 RepID=UPI003216BA6D